MPNYKSPDNQIHFLDSTEFEHLLPAGSVPISDADLAILRAPTLAQAQANQIATLTASYSSVIQLPVAYMSTTFQADTDSQNTLNKVLVALNGAVPSGFYWVDASNNQVAMTFAQLQGLAAAMMAQGWTAFTRLQTLKAQVKSATTVSAVQAVLW